MKSKNEQPKNEQPKNKQPKKGCTVDTNAAIELYHNPNFSGPLIQHLYFEGCDIHLCPQVILELRQKGYDIDDIIKIIQSTIGGTVIVGGATDDMNDDAKWLENTHPPLYKGHVILHRADSLILAYVLATETTLITCDKGLEIAAVLSYTKIINPHTLTRDASTDVLYSNNTSTNDPYSYDPYLNEQYSKLYELVPAAISKLITKLKAAKTEAAKTEAAKTEAAKTEAAKTVTTKQKIRSFALKPGEKIIWSTFN